MADAAAQQPFDTAGGDGPSSVDAHGAIITENSFAPQGGQAPEGTAPSAEVMGGPGAGDQADFALAYHPDADVSMRGGAPLQPPEASSVMLDVTAAGQAPAPQAADDNTFDSPSGTEEDMLEDDTDPDLAPAAPMEGAEKEEEDDFQQNGDAAASSSSDEDMPLSLRASSLDQGADAGSSGDEHPLAMRPDDESNGHPSDLVTMGTHVSHHNSSQPSSAASQQDDVPDRDDPKDGSLSSPAKKLKTISVNAPASGGPQTGVAPAALRLPLGRSISHDHTTSPTAAASPRATSSPSTSSPRVVVLPKIKRCGTGSCR